MILSIQKKTTRYKNSHSFNSNPSSGISA